MPGIPTSSTAGGDAAGGLTGAELRSRTAGGAAMLGGRGILVFAVGVAVNLALATLLSPRDFGLLALGLVLVVLGSHLAEGGFGASLIRREEEPTRQELEAVQGLQLVTTTTVALLAAAVAAPLGRDALVIAVMAASLPVVVLRSPSLIMLERRLLYGPIARADVVEAGVFYAWALGTVLMGMGVWGLATAVVARSVAGTAALVAGGPMGLVRPRWAWEKVRPLVGFGMRFQAASLAAVAREQAMNVGLALVGGLAVLGVWNLAWRVLQIPLLLFGTAGRVGFPAMSRLLGAGGDPRHVIERAVGALAALSALVMVAVVAAAPALPELVGEEWSDVPSLVLVYGGTLAVTGPTGIIAIGYLFAVGSPGAVLRSTVISTVAWLAVALPLVPVVGAPAVALGWVVGGGVNVILLWRSASQSGARIGRVVAWPSTAGVAGMAVAWLIADGVGDPVSGTALALFAGEAVVAAGLTAGARTGIGDLRVLARHALERGTTVSPRIG